MSPLESPYVILRLKCGMSKCDKKLFKPDVVVDDVQITLYSNIFALKRD